MSAVKASPGLIELGKDGCGEDRFTSREMIETEQRLDRAVARLSDGRGFGLPTASLQSGLDAAGSGGLVLGKAQRAGLVHIPDARRLSIVAGYAGTGKNAMLGVRRDIGDSAALHGRGAALSGRNRKRVGEGK